MVDSRNVLDQCLVRPVIGEWLGAVLAYQLSPPGDKLVVTAAAFFAYFCLLIVVNLIRDVVASVKSGRTPGPEAGLLSQVVTGWILGMAAVAKAT